MTFLLGLLQAPSRGFVRFDDACISGSASIGFVFTTSFLVPKVLNYKAWLIPQANPTFCGRFFFMVSLFSMSSEMMKKCLSTFRHCRASAFQLPNAVFLIVELFLTLLTKSLAIIDPVLTGHHQRSNKSSIRLCSNTSCVVFVPRDDANVLEWYWERFFT